MDVQNAKENRLRENTVSSVVVNEAYEFVKQDVREILWLTDKTAIDYKIEPDTFKNKKKQFYEILNLDPEYGNFSDNGVFWRTSYTREEIMKSRTAAFERSIYKADQIREAFSNVLADVKEDALDLF